MPKTPYELFANYTIEYNYIPLPGKRMDSLRGILHGVEIDSQENVKILADFTYYGDHWDLYRNRTGSIDRRIYPKDPEAIGLNELSVFSKLKGDQATVYVGAKILNERFHSLPWHVTRMGLGLVATSYLIQEVANREEISGELTVTNEQLTELSYGTTFRRLMF